MMGWVGCRKFVERELTARFYKHTAVALHDWQTYAQLAALARDRLSLEVEVPDLPGLVVDPGVCFMADTALLHTVTVSCGTHVVGEEMQKSYHQELQRGKARSGPL